MITDVAICSICSRKKDPREEMLPAHQRYTGTHVAVVAFAAGRVGAPFYMLSGKFGLIPGDREIPDYDYLLTDAHVDELSEMIVGQLKEYGLKRLHLYLKEKPDWRPYKRALEIAAQIVGVTLQIHELPDDA